MRYAKISLAALSAKAAVRPAGYQEEVKGSAKTITATHAYVPEPAYKRLLARYSGAAAGPGTELKALLKTIGIVAKPNCSCNKRAKIMDEKGCDWCDENIDEISGWLEEEAKKRKLPYVHAAGKMLIRLAIRRARKKGNKK